MAQGMWVRGDQVWCPRHGYALYEAKAWGEVLSATLEVLHRVVLQLNLDGDPDMAAVLDALAPLCCYLGDEDVVEVLSRHLSYN